MRWFRGPDLPSTQLLYYQTCTTSVGSDTVYVLNAVYMLSYNFTGKKWRFHTPPDINSDDQVLDSCVFHLKKDYRRYVYL